MEHEPVGGSLLPGIGLGTTRKVGDDGLALIEAALAEGYRHLDTARHYDNEETVGRALQRSSVPRDEVWITTKLLHPKSPPQPDLSVALDESLRMLRTDRVELLLLHWPRPDLSLEWILSRFVELRDQGKVRWLGVANFPPTHLEEALAIVPDLVTDQVEYHPLLGHARLLELVRRRDMVLMAHSPLAGKGRHVLDHPVLATIANDHGVSTARVVLRWLVQQERVVAIPGASSLAQLRDNLAALELRLDEDEMAMISDLDQGLRTVDPPHGPSWEDG